MQQILLKLWIFIHLHIYFILHKRPQKTHNLVLLPIYYLNVYSVYTFICYFRVQTENNLIYNFNAYTTTYLLGMPVYKVIICQFGVLIIYNF